MRHSTMLDAIEDLIGPDILCWNTLFWVKEAESEAFVSWKRSDSSGAWAVALLRPACPPPCLARRSNTFAQVGAPKQLAAEGYSA